MTQKEILCGVADVAVAVDGESTLRLALLGHGGADVLGVFGGGVQGTGVLLDALRKHDPVAHLGLGSAVGLHGEDEIIRPLNADVIGAGLDAFFGLDLGQGFRNFHGLSPFLVVLQL